MYDNINDDGQRPFSGNVNAAGKAVAAGALDPDERVIVYERMSTGNVVYELVKDSSADRGFSRKERKKYAPGENSKLDAQTIAGVVGDIRTLFPEGPDWGFAFGSHGLGWIPKSNTVTISRKSGALPAVTEHPFAELWAERENSPTRYFRGYGQNLDVSEFVDALDGWEWDFILLDDCFMASVEALYDMRSLADYIIASPTEIWVEGFPYDRVVQSVFGDWTETGFIEVAGQFVDYYERQRPDYACATVAVVKTAEMDALAETVRRLNLGFGELNPETQNIQSFERISTPSHVFYDLDHYLSTIRGGTMPAEYNAFRAQLDRTVVYCNSTKRFFSIFDHGGYVDVKHFSGLAVFIPWSGTNPLMDMYRQTAWYEYVYAP
jgi:hypothetical protein